MSQPITFSLLPLELRYQIWSYVLHTSPRLVFLGITGLGLDSIDKIHVISRTSAVSVLSINHESRSFALSSGFYHKAFAYNDINNQLAYQYVNFNTDVIVIDLGSIQYIAKEDCERIRNLVARTGGYRRISFDSDSTYQSPRNLLLMKNLKEFTIRGGCSDDQEATPQEILDLSNDIRGHSGLLGAQFVKSFGLWDRHLAFLTGNEFCDEGKEYVRWGDWNEFGLSLMRWLWRKFVDVVGWGKELKAMGEIPRSTGLY